MLGQATKTCSKCGETKALDQFAFKGDRNPRHDPRRKDCKPCVRIYMRAYHVPKPAMPDASLPGESWRTVVGYEGRYEVSDLGRVRRMTPGANTRINRLLKPTIKHSTGYLCVELYGGARRAEQWLIHRLVALAFLGSPPSPEHQVNHIDGARTNNVRVNLEWVTAQENIQHGHQRRRRLPATR